MLYEQCVKFTLTIPWPIASNAPITLIDKFSLLTHTDEQNLYFDNFFYDKCTCSKASMLAFEQVHLS